MTGMLEMVLVFDTEGRAIFWKGPKGSFEGYVQDSELLWDRIWSARDRIGGVAHTHPWAGEAHPSYIDVTTFEAIERGLGQRLLWPIVTMTEVGYFHWNLARGYERTKSPFEGNPWWIDNVEELRRVSGGPSLRVDGSALASDDVERLGSGRTPSELERKLWTECVHGIKLSSNCPKCQKGQ